VSINVWKFAGDTLNITCNYLYCNHQVHRDFLITLYISMHSESRHCMEVCQSRPVVAMPLAQALLYLWSRRAVWTLCRRGESRAAVGVRRLDCSVRRLVTAHKSLKQKHTDEAE
jgi:hypothetical protein